LFNTQNYDWTGETCDRLSLTLRLHYVLYGDRGFNEATFNAVLPWAITLSTREWQRKSNTQHNNYPEDVLSHSNEAEEEESQERRIREFIPRQILQHSPQSFESFYTWIISNETFRLPPSLLSDLGSAVRELLKGTGALSAANCLDKLFLHFLTTRASDTQPGEDQQRILASIIGILSDAASQAGMGNWESNTTKNLLKKWHAFLLRSKACEEEPNTDVQAKPDETGFHHSNEAGGPTERNLVAGDSFAISPAISIPILLQLVEAALNSSAEQDIGRKGQHRTDSAHIAADLYHPLCRGDVRQ
jgi:hypothetical protein